MAPFTCSARMDGVWRAAVAQDVGNAANTAAIHFDLQHPKPLGRNPCRSQRRSATLPTRRKISLPQTPLPELAQSFAQAPTPPARKAVAVKPSPTRR